MIRVGVVGFGYWGPNVARNFAASKDFKLVRVSDIDPARAESVTARFPGTEFTTKAEEITKAKDIDCVAVVTPVFTHFDLAKTALENGKHVLLTKPLVRTTEEAKKLIEIAEAKNLIVMVDHTFLFTPVVEKIKELLDSQELGSIYYYDSVRVNLGLIQSDINVIWDLAPHDLSIVDFIFPEKPLAVSAAGSGHFGTKHVDVAYLTLRYPNNVIAHFHVNWLSPVKVRKTLIGGSKKMLLWDDLENDNKVKIYDRGVSVDTRDEQYKILTQYRMGDMYSPAIDFGEALGREVTYLAECINSGTKPHNDAEAGMRIVNILEMAEKSLASKSEFIALD